MPYQTLLSGLQPPSPQLGVIEGFFGKGWSWEARARYAQWLPRQGYGFYLYAPKEDGYLRKHWAKPWPAAQLEALRQLARQRVQLVGAARDQDHAIARQRTFSRQCAADAARSAGDQRHGARGRRSG